MSSGCVVDVPQEQRLARIAVALRNQWPMIEAVALRPSQEGTGFVAEVRLDPIVLKGSFEQQGYPRTPEDLAEAEARRLAVIAECVESVNAKLPAAEAIQSFRVVG